MQSAQRENNFGDQRQSTSENLISPWRQEWIQTFIVFYNNESTFGDGEEVDSKQKEKGRHSRNGSERGFEVGQGLTHLKPNITLASVTFYDYVLKKK